MTTHTASETASVAGFEQWDLTRQISPYLDRHLIFPLLEYLDTLIEQHKIQYDATDVAAARLALLRPTHMVDYAIDMYKSIHGANATVPPEMEQQKKTVYQELEKLKEACAPLDALVKNTELKNKLVAAHQWNVATVQARHGVTNDMLDTYRKLARFHFDCGDYQTSRDMLETYISLHASPPMVKDDNNEGGDEELLGAAATAGTTTSNATPASASSSSSVEVGNAHMYYLASVDRSMLHVLWGRLAAEILESNWEAASKAVDAIKTGMENMVTHKQLSALDALQQRTWLLHWSLFVFWNDPSSASTTGGLEALVELCLSDKYKQAITTNAPHLLRYLTAAVLLCKRRVTSSSNNTTNKKINAHASNAEARRLMKSLIYVMQDCEYSDPIVEFVNCLCVKFDFELAQEKLGECEQVLQRDFFLCHQTSLFMEEARVFVFENYCRIHHKIDLAALGAQLAMDPDAAERWIVDLIRGAGDLQATIDVQNGCVLMGNKPQSVYEQVLDKTRDLNMRCATLSQNVQHMLQNARKHKARKERAAMEE